MPWITIKHLSFDLKSLRVISIERNLIVFNSYDSNDTCHTVEFESREKAEEAFHELTDLINSLTR